MRDVAHTLRLNKLKAVVRDDDDAGEASAATTSQPSDQALLNEHSSTKPKAAVKVSSQNKKFLGII